MQKHNSISHRKYKIIAKWLDAISEEELSFIDAFIEAVEFEMEEMMLLYSDYSESEEILKKIMKK